ncbi:MAG: AMP-dependent synthetase/ligase in alkane synthesis cluster [Candidatus Ozemobacter sibiricus]|uniref:AMP-dependent synthetase/ligase in alkane synthesis cluster n=1 Tax=Candidatus Ozemobacter sibiricus TaxID=2268124 RepID=A0A367ZCF7_9BACT|nr:MAG: AMP-dependent synthetase/ligase in alkane synthesis cluster [Candidatus Ozemobacter sibiricus]
MALPRIGYDVGKVSLRNNCFCFLQEHVDQHPERVCMKWVNTRSKLWFDYNPFARTLTHDTFTYKDVYDWVVHVAAGYQKLGIQKGDLALVYLPMIPWMYAGMFGFQMLGATCIFLDSFARAEHLGYVAKLCKPKVWLSGERGFAMAAGHPDLEAIPIKINMGPCTRTWTARFEDLLKTPEAAEPVPLEQEHTALITFTTGSSGTPKGADRSHRFLAAQHYAIDACLPYLETDLDLPVFPIFSLNNLAAGVPTVLPAINVAEPADTDAYVLYTQIKGEGITTMTLNPSLLNGLNKYCLEKGLTLPGLRRVAVGGAAVSRDVVADFAKIAPQAELVVMYGSTEAEPMCHITGREMLAQRSVTEDDPELVDAGVNVGHFAEGLQYKFIKLVRGPVEVSSDQQWAELEVPRGSVGELLVAGEHVCRAYYNDPEAFRKSKVRDHHGIVWHRTGDLGRLDEKGQVWIVGRLHNVIERAGEYLFPVQPEVILKRQPYTRLAAFLGVPDPQLGEKTVCVIAPKDPADLGNARLCAEREAEIRRIMAKNKIPVDQVIFYPDIPMDLRHRSKVEYAVLRDHLKKAGLV